MISTRRTLGAVLLIAPLAWAGALTTAQVVRAAAAGVGLTTVTGWVVDANGWVADLSFWLGKGDSGAADVKGAQARAEDDEPLVLVSDSGYIYYPLVPTPATGPADIPSLMEYCEQRVRVTGQVIMRGDERGIVIDSVAAYAPMSVPGSTQSGK